MQNIIKRIIDILISIIAILFFIPFWLLIAFALKSESKWKAPILYLHKRVGKGGKEFTCCKFRTMYVGSNPDLLPSTASDERITPVGKFLRHTSLDETPQLINVLLGHMSIVGPRPALPSQVAKFSKAYHDKLLVKPGLTGWTQVNGRNAISYEKRMELDCWYAKNWNMFLDLFILLKTPFVIFKQEGIYDAK